jgi:hypothetical protein
MSDHYLGIFTQDMELGAGNKFYTYGYQTDNHIYLPGEPQPQRSQAVTGGVAFS